MKNPIVTFQLLLLTAAAAATFAPVVRAQGVANASAPAAKAHELSRAEFEALLARPEKLLLIDLRRPDELTRIGGFPVYLSIQSGDLEKSLAWIPKDRTIVTVSNHAVRSGRAADLLASKGFKVAGTVGAQTYEEQGGQLTKIVPPPPRTSAPSAAPAAAPAPAAAAAPAPSPAKQAIEARQAIYTLINTNFRPLGGLLQGRTQYDAADFQKRIARLEFLSELARDAFPDVSNGGLPDTKAKAQIWTQRADFDKRLADFAAHVKTLAQVNAKEQGPTDAFKAALAGVAQDCKGCHDNYREK